MSFATPQNIIMAVVLFLSLVSLALTIWQHRRLSTLLKGTDGKSLESTIKMQGEMILALKERLTETIDYVQHVDKRVKAKVSSIELIRFNPFHGSGIGGDNSFSAAFVDEEGSGVVLSGLHTRERTNIFAKPLQKWQSNHELSEEEKSVLEKTRVRI